ncbi:pentatricopeptide repeat-containing protein [Senna tora]|uniref:Pentatricopeptide repeat-containing protein n=1 Tax=Senna tora TaxID=362788 RepID=A0A834WDY9_9FABA|nr:pentatricopeptide repeat-containing protein [Senna tora]
MWAVRRASISLRSQGFSAGTCRACCVKLTPTTIVEDEAGISESQISSNPRSLKTLYHTGHTFLNIIGGRRELSSQADARTKKEVYDMEYGVSELGTHDNNGNGVELISEQEISYDNEDVEELHKIDSTGKKSHKKWAQSNLLKAITNLKGLPVNSILAKWVEEGKELSRSEISVAMINLCGRRMYQEALQLSEWVESKQQIEFTETDYISRVDLIAKVHGVHKAEMYVERIPNSFRGEKVYSTLLANWVSQHNVKKAEETFSKMKDLGLRISTFTYDQLLFLYKWTNKKKVAHVISLMEKDNVKPSLSTYKILIDTKGYFKDIAGMEQIVEIMKTEGVEPNYQIKASLAKHYVSAGLEKKAEAVLKEMEGDNLKENRGVCGYLLPIYADMGKADEVERIWTACESEDPRTLECFAAIEALGKVKKIEKAEAIFEMMMNKWEQLSSRQYAVLLRVYANNNMLLKAKDLIKRMANSGRRVDSYTLDALVKLYVQAGEVEKADTFLHKAFQENQTKAAYGTYKVILNEYARRGDIHNTEKIFLRMREAGYSCQMGTYLTLLDAYINAKVPAYGIRDRMMADNLYPDVALARRLPQVDAFMTTSNGPSNLKKTYERKPKKKSKHQIGPEGSEVEKVGAKQGSDPSNLKTYKRNPKKKSKQQIGPEGNEVEKVGAKQGTSMLAAIYTPVAIAQSSAKMLCLPYFDMYFCPLYISTYFIPFSKLKFYCKVSCLKESTFHVSASPVSMWAVRRASISLRSQGFSAGTCRACCVKLTPTTIVEDDAGISESQMSSNPRSLRTLYHTGHTFLNIIGGRRELSSQADARTKKEVDDMEYGISELGTHDNNGNGVELIYEQEISYDNEDVEELHKIDSTGKKSHKKWAQSNLLKAITNLKGLPVNSILAKWVEEGKELSRSEISVAMINLCRRRMYREALQLSEWVESKQQIEFTETDYVSRVDLIAKVHGVHKAEMYVERIPNSFRGEKVYSTLLANWVRQHNVKKAAETFSKMKDLGLRISTFTYEQLLFLYMCTNKKKVAHVLSLMEKDKVEPSLFIYKILIDTKGYCKDIAGMEQIVEIMKTEGVEPNYEIKVSLAKHYVSAGLEKKAEAVLKEMEGDNLKENRWVCRYLLPIYADMGKADEVERIWAVCESEDPRTLECFAAIEALGKVKKIEKAEAIFEMMMNKWEQLSSRQYAVLLRVYANNNMLLKAKDLIKRMANSGRRVDSYTLDALVKLYVQAGEVEKADTFLHKAFQENQTKAAYGTYKVILNEYARRGDIHNTEKIFLRMRQAGYTSQISIYHTLLDAYINAKVPAYGIRERMIADNLFPNDALASRLPQVDAFRTTSNGPSNLKKTYKRKPKKKSKQQIGPEGNEVEKVGAKQGYKRKPKNKSKQQIGSEGNELEKVGVKQGTNLIAK